MINSSDKETKESFSIFKQILHSILMNILRETDSYLDFQQIFPCIKNYQTF